MSKGETIEMLDYLEIDYESQRWEEDFDPDIDDKQVAFESWIEISEPQEYEVVKEIDGYKVDVDVEDVMSKEMTPVTESMTVMDSEVDIENTETNLILVGGPVANNVTKTLVSKNVSTVDWYESDGEIEYVEYGDNEQLIVAGKTRTETQEAAVELMNSLE